MDSPPGDYMQLVGWAHVRARVPYPVNFLLDGPFKYLHGLICMQTMKVYSVIISFSVSANPKKRINCHFNDSILLISFNYIFM